MSLLAFITALTIQFLYVLDTGASPYAISSPLSFGSRSILRSIEKGSDAKPDYAVELNATDFESVLKATPASYAVVEFFAGWCPACRNYKPQYEKVSRLFNGADAVHTGIILMTRVDCASKINTNLCDKFSIDHYPMLLWGPPSEFISGSWDPKKEKCEIIPTDDMRTAERLLTWINKKLNSSYGLDDEKYENEQRQQQTNASDLGQIARAIYDVEEATSTAFDIILDHKMIKSETQASFVKFLQLLVVHHPSKRCRQGTADILVGFYDILSTKGSVRVTDEDALRNFHICGNDVPRGSWMFCRGSKNETRGFSCGLWVLLHSLSVRVEDGETHTAFTTMCDFIHDFFICEECRQHFYDMCSSVKKPFKKSRELVLWLWNAHNQVNARLMKVEASLKTADPNFPKMIWPPIQLCPSCYQSKTRKDSDLNQIQWDHDEVYRLLLRYYGEKLASLRRDKEVITHEEHKKAQNDDSVSLTHTVVVPLGAALAIALASCGFGALACYWRQQQKIRKYKHHPNSLKVV